MDEENSYNDRVSQNAEEQEDENDALDDVDIDEDDYHLHLRDRQLKKQLKLRKAHPNQQSGGHISQSTARPTSGKAELLNSATKLLNVPSGRRKPRSRVVVVQGSHYELFGPDGALQSTASHVPAKAQVQFAKQKAPTPVGKATLHEGYSF